MLVLTRRVGEKLVIGNGVIVEVLSAGGEGVRLGIVAPRETSVHRFEVFVEIESANRAASMASAGVTSATVEGVAARLSARKESVA
jgi:carbon storage regulator